MKTVTVGSGCTRRAVIPIHSLHVYTRTSYLLLRSMNDVRLSNERRALLLLGGRLV